jgi:hypothetical protein
MPRDSKLALLAVVAVVAVACGVGSNPLTRGEAPGDDPLFVLLSTEQQRWCLEITGQSCDVYTSPHPEFAAWVDWRVPAPTVFWNERVLTDRQFWITNPRMAHEACHLKHGPQPGWTTEEKEAYADQCARAYTGAAP